MNMFEFGLSLDDDQCIRGICHIIVQKLARLVALAHSVETRASRSYAPVLGSLQAAKMDPQLGRFCAKLLGANLYSGLCEYS